MASIPPLSLPQLKERLQVLYREVDALDQRISSFSPDSVATSQAPSSTVSLEARLAVVQAQMTSLAIRGACIHKLTEIENERWHLGDALTVRFTESHIQMFQRQSKLSEGIQKAAQLIQNGAFSTSMQQLAETNRLLLQEKEQREQFPQENMLFLSELKDFDERLRQLVDKIAASFSTPIPQKEVIANK